MLLQRVQQCGHKPGIACHEFIPVLRTVDPSQVEHKVRLGAVHVQERRLRIQVILIYLSDLNSRTGPVFTVPQIVQIGDQVLPHKALGSCYQYIHQVFLHTVRFTMPV